MQIDVVVQRQNNAQATGPEEGQCLSQHEHENEGAIKVQALATRSREDGEDVAVSVLDATRNEQAQIDDDEHGEETHKDVVVLKVGGGEAVVQRFPDLLRLLRHRDQPPVDTDAEVLQQPTMLLQLIFESIVSDCSLVHRIRIFEHGQGEILNLFVGEFHSVLVHTGTDYVLQFLVLDQTVPINVIDLEEELDLVLWRLPRELVDCVDELLHGHGSRVVLVEDLEDTFAKE